MKKIFKIIAFQIGVDCLGFPQFHNHTIEDFKIVDSQFFRAHSKK